jgi:hypothetical protein
MVKKNKNCSIFNIDVQGKKMIDRISKGLLLRGCQL